MLNNRGILTRESCNKKMARICPDAMHSINPGLEFTTETQEYFSKERLPTLDLELWQENNTTTQIIVVMVRSAMIQVLSNYPTRRIFNIQNTENGVIYSGYNRGVHSYDIKQSQQLPHDTFICTE